MAKYSSVLLLFLMAKSFGWPSNWLIKGQPVLGQSIKLSCALLDQSLHLNVGTYRRASIKCLTVELLCVQLDSAPQVFFVDTFFLMAGRERDAVTLQQCTCHFEYLGRGRLEMASLCLVSSVTTSPFLLYVCYEVVSLFYQLYTAMMMEFFEADLKKKKKIPTTNP